MSEKKNTPKKQLRIGACCVSVWEHQDESGKSYATFSLQRSYKRKDKDEWEYSSTFRKGDFDELEAILRSTREFMEREC